jgi:hypothetical protein
LVFEFFERLLDQQANVCFVINYNDKSFDMCAPLHLLLRELGMMGSLFESKSKYEISIPFSKRAEVLTEIVFFESSDRRSP